MSLRESKWANKKLYDATKKAERALENKNAAGVQDAKVEAGGAVALKPNQAVAEVAVTAQPPRNSTVEPKTHELSTAPQFSKGLSQTRSSHRPSILPKKLGKNCKVACLSSAERSLHVHNTPKLSHASCEKPVQVPAIPNDTILSNNSICVGTVQIQTNNVTVLERNEKAFRGNQQAPNHQLSITGLLSGHVKGTIEVPKLTFAISMPSPLQYRMPKFPDTLAKNSDSRNQIRANHRSTAADQESPQAVSSSNTKNTRPGRPFADQLALRTIKMPEIDLAAPRLEPANSTHEENKREGKRNSKWVTAKEFRQNERLNRRDERRANATRACSNSGTLHGSVRSVKADIGSPNNEGNQPQTTEPLHELANWDGTLVSPHIPWEERRTFTDPQMKDRIEGWIVDKHEETEIIVLTEKELYPDYELVKKSWAISHIDRFPLEVWWRHHLKFPGVEEDIAPWWQRIVPANTNLVAIARQPDSRLDLADNDMTKASTQTARDSQLQFDNNTLRRMEKRRKQKARAETMANEQFDIPENPYAPSVPIYIRPAHAEDLRQITEIWNHYIQNTVFCAEMHPLSESEIRGRVEDINQVKLPFLAAIHQASKNTVKRAQGVKAHKSEHVVGFAFADDFNDVRGMFRYTAELEIFVKDGFQKRGIGRALFDQMLQFLDPTYASKACCPFVAHNMLEYGAGGKRVLANILVNIPYQANDKLRIEWIEKWLGANQFQQVGKMAHAGHKLGSIVSFATYRRFTGHDIKGNAF